MGTPASTISPNRSWGRRLVFPLLFFVGGVGAAGWVVTQTGAGRSLAGLEAPLIEHPASKAPVATPLAPVQPILGAPLGSEADARIAALELRLARIESSGGASGGAHSSQSDGLLLAFAARRALELGLPLGSLEQAISAHFGASQPHMVAAISSAARVPTTLSKLQADLESLAPKLSGEDKGVWSRFSEGLASLVTVRRGDTSTTDPSALIAQARSAIEASDVDGALQAVSRLPNRAFATDWMASARRYSEAQRALAALEKSALGDVSQPQEPPAAIDALPITPSAPQERGQTGA